MGPQVNDGSDREPENQFAIGRVPGVQTVSE